MVDFLLTHILSRQDQEQNKYIPPALMNSKPKSNVNLKSIQ